MKIELLDILRAEARSFVLQNLEALEAVLAPDLFDQGLRLAALRGRSADDLVRRFAFARSAWEKYVWVQLGEHWIRQELSLEESIHWVNEDVLSLSERIETQITEVYGKPPKPRSKLSFAA